MADNQLKSTKDALSSHATGSPLKAPRTKNRERVGSHAGSQQQTYTLSLTHLMKVGPPTNNHDLSIAWIAKVCRQLPLSRPVPAHVEEDLDDDKYYNHSEREKQEGEITPT